MQLQPEKWLSQLRGMAWSLHWVLEETKTQPSVPKEWTPGLSSFQQSLSILEAQPMSLSWTSEDFRESLYCCRSYLKSEVSSWKRQDSPCGNHFCGSWETEGLLSTQDIPLYFPVTKTSGARLVWVVLALLRQGMAVRDRTHPRAGSLQCVGRGPSPPWAFCPTHRASDLLKFKGLQD